MWFNPKLLVTDALRKLKSGNRNRTETELIMIIQHIMDSQNLSEYNFCVNDIFEWLQHYKIRSDSAFVRKLVRDDWKLIPSENSNMYTRYLPFLGGDILENKGKGRYYTINKKKLKEIDEMMHFF